jgi:hypothetical protein
MFFQKSNRIAREYQENSNGASEHDISTLSNLISPSFLLTIAENLS